MMQGAETVAKDNGCSGLSTQIPELSHFNILCTVEDENACQ